MTDMVTGACGYRAMCMYVSMLGCSHIIVNTIENFILHMYSIICHLGVFGENEEGGGWGRGSKQWILGQAHMSPNIGLCGWTVG